MADTYMPLLSFRTTELKMPATPEYELASPPRICNGVIRFAYETSNIVIDSGVEKTNTETHFMTLFCNNHTRLVSKDKTFCFSCESLNSGMSLVVITDPSSCYAFALTDANGYIQGLYKCRRAPGHGHSTCLKHANVPLNKILFIGVEEFREKTSVSSSEEEKVVKPKYKPRKPKVPSSSSTDEEEEKPKYKGYKESKEAKSFRGRGGKKPFRGRGGK